MLLTNDIERRCGEGGEQGQGRWREDQRKSVWCHWKGERQGVWRFGFRQRQQAVRLPGVFCFVGLQLLLIINAVSLEKADRASRAVRRALRR
jgi:hypothetical protein